MRFFETIRIEDGKIFHIAYHNRRLNETILKNFQIHSQIDLKRYIDPPKKGLYRCKVHYEKEIKRVEFFPYTPKEPTSLKPVEADFEYPYKYSDRSAIENILKNSGADEVLFVKNTLLRDTSIANIALMIDGIWYTPKNPLLKGTTRQRLLEEGFLKERSLSLNDLKRADKIAFMNAMIGFYLPKNLKIIY